MKIIKSVGSSVPFEKPKTFAQRWSSLSNTQKVLIVATSILAVGFVAYAMLKKNRFEETAAAAAQQIESLNTSIQTSSTVYLNSHSLNGKCEGFVSRATEYIQIGTSSKEAEAHMHKSLATMKAAASKATTLFDYSFKGPIPAKSLQYQLNYKWC